jgi:hypothetical protein
MSPSIELGGKLPSSLQSYDRNEKYISSAITPSAFARSSGTRTLRGEGGGTTAN